jgi:predicted transcriptional regulator
MALYGLMGRIVCAYVSNTSVRTTDLPSLIQGVHAALARLAAGPVQGTPEGSHGRPTASQVRKSVTPQGIVSFLDGKSYKTMKRHLARHGLDAQGYRARFGLPLDYPMVAPEYAALRSAMARSIGLGRGRRGIVTPGDA